MKDSGLINLEWSELADIINKECRESEDEYIDIRFKGSTMQIQEAQQHKKSTAEMPFD